MEWERIEDENQPPTAKAARGRAFLKLEIIEGPHAGQTFSMGGHHNDTMIVGKDPKANSKPSTKDAFAVSLPEDEYVSSLHAKFVLTSNKNVHSLKVTDMSSSNGTIVGGSSLAKGKSKQAFPGTTIQVGDSVFKISKC
jgi:pSer/pThr/pTyr-binding forkhead associated (FHA) protein